MEFHIHRSIVSPRYTLHQFTDFHLDLFLRLLQRRVPSGLGCIGSGGITILSGFHLPCFRCCRSCFHLPCFLWDTHNRLLWQRVGRCWTTSTGIRLFGRSKRPVKLERFDPHLPSASIIASELLAPFSSLILSADTSGFARDSFPSISAVNSIRSSLAGNAISSSNSCNRASIIASSSSDTSYGLSSSSGFSLSS